MDINLIAVSSLHEQNTTASDLHWDRFALCLLFYYQLTKRFKWLEWGNVNSLLGHNQTSYCWQDVAALHFCIMKDDVRDPEMLKAGLTIMLLCLIIHSGRADERLNKLVTQWFSASYILVMIRIIKNNLIRFFSRRSNEWKPCQATQHPSPPWMGCFTGHSSIVALQSFFLLSLNLSNTH